MKMLLITALYIGLMALGVDANATIYSNTQNLGSVLIKDSYSWTHATPVDFEVPFDNVNAATLLINAISDDGNNHVFVENKMIGKLDGGLWSWSTFDPADFFVQWDNGQKLNVTVSPHDKYLYLLDSIFTLDYNNGYPPVNPPSDPIPNPEPATLLLLGSGLSGLAFWGKRRRVAV